MTPKRQEMEALKSILDQEIVIYEEVETLLGQKQSIIVKGDLPALSALDSQLEQLTQTVKSLEEERLALMVSIGREGETLQQFISCLQSQDDEALLNYSRTKLVKTIESIKALSRSNHDLLTYSIHLVEQSVSFIASLLSPQGASYGSTVNALARGNSSTRDLSGLASTICHEV